MIFELPKSKSHFQTLKYEKHISKDRLKIAKRSFSQFQAVKNKILKKNTQIKFVKKVQQKVQAPKPKLCYGKYIQTPKKLLIYSDGRSKSCDKYLQQNKKSVQKKIFYKNLNPQQKRIFQYPLQNKNIFSGKKLVDPLHQKYKYCIKQLQSSLSSPFLVEQFLLQPCLIKSKQIQRPFTSVDMYKSDFQWKNINTVTKHNRRNNSSKVRTTQTTWKKCQDNKFDHQIQAKNNQFAMDLFGVSPKSKNIQPWDHQTSIMNFDSIRIL